MTTKKLLIFILTFISINIYWSQSKGISKVPLISIDSVQDYICKSDLLHKDIVMKQAIAETGWFKSYSLIAKGNLFGFRGKYYLTFSTWKESVDYYVTWQKKYYKNPNENYYQFLERIGYGSRGYSTRLKKMVKYQINCK